MSYTVSVGKGARGRYREVLTLKVRADNANPNAETLSAAEGFARLTAAMVPDGYRAKVEAK